MRNPMEIVILTTYPVREGVEIVRIESMDERCPCLKIETVRIMRDVLWRVIGVIREQAVKVGVPCLWSGDLIDHVCEWNDGLLEVMSDGIASLIWGKSEIRLVVLSVGNLCENVMNTLVPDVGQGGFHVCFEDEGLIARENVGNKVRDVWTCELKVGV